MFKDYVLLNDWQVIASADNVAVGTVQSIRLLEHDLATIVGAGLATIVGTGLTIIVGAGLGNKFRYSPINEQQNPPSPPLTEQQNPP